MNQNHYAWFMERRIIRVWVQTLVLFEATEPGEWEMGRWDEPSALKGMHPTSCSFLFCLGHCKKRKQMLAYARKV